MKYDYIRLIRSDKTKIEENEKLFKRLMSVTNSNIITESSQEDNSTESEAI